MQKQILTILVYGDKLSTPQLAKMLKVSPATVEYHLKRLAEADIVKNTNPPSSGIRKYGKKYYLNQKYQPNTKKALLLTAVTFFLTLSGISTLFVQISISAILLVLPSLLGIYYSLKLYRNQYIAAVETALKDFEKFKMEASLKENT